MSHAQIEAAIRKFQAAGGFIKELPPAVEPFIRPVGDYHGAYERVLDEQELPWTPPATKEATGE